MRSCFRRMLAVAVSAVLIGCGGGDTPTSPGPVARNTNFLAAEPFLFNLDGTGRLEMHLTGINGSILVTGGPVGSGVTISGTREVRSDSIEDARVHLAQLQVDVQDAGSEILIQTRQPQDSEGRNYVVDYQVRLPASIQLFIDNVNGSLDLKGMSGGVSSNLVNGRTEATLEVPAGGSVALTTVNGELVLHIPRGTSAEFSAQVVNGTITLTDLSLQNESRTSTSLSGRLGAGNGTVTLRTTNGAIRVEGTP